MESHSVTYHPTEVIVQPLPSAEAGTQLCDPGEMQGWVDLVWPVAYQDGMLYKLNRRDGLDDNRFMLHLKAIDPYVKIEILRLSLSPLSLIKWLNIDSKWPVEPTVNHVTDFRRFNFHICADLCSRQANSPQSAVQQSQRELMSISSSSLLVSSVGARAVNTILVC